MPCSPRECSLVRRNQKNDEVPLVRQSSERGTSSASEIKGKKIWQAYDRSHAQGRTPEHYLYAQ